MECISNASYVVATMTSQCRYDVTDAAAVASDRIALYREAAAEYIESYRQTASAEGASTEHDRRRGSSGVGAICC